MLEITTNVAISYGTVTCYPQQQQGNFIFFHIFSSVTVKRFDVTVQWAETNLLRTSSKTLD